MKQLLLIIFFMNFIYATNNNIDFDKFENQFNLGYKLTQMGLINGNHNTVATNSQSINMEIEHLFTNNIWIDANLNNVINYSQPFLGPSYLNGGDGNNRLDNQAFAFGQNPFMYSLTLRGGYAFYGLDNKFQMIPYLMFGRDANWSASTIVANGFNSISVDYFLTGGIGLKLSYAVNSKLLLFADQLVSYEWDNSGAIKHIQTLPPEEGGYGKSYAATNYQFTSTIGVKYNIYDNIQIGLSGIYNNYQHQSNIAGLVYIPQHTFAEMISVGYTY